MFSIRYCVLFFLENNQKIGADFFFIIIVYVNNVRLLGRNFRLLQICCLLGFFLITVQIAVLFGAKILEHVLNLCRGKCDFLDRLPVPLLLDIISFLELEDIARLSQVSLMHDGKKIVENLYDTITPEMKELALEMGWKHFFSTNRIQLQLQL
uniref:F-box domain-containing protein n=1 Tax=Anser cygnoides TaxID=8845 RepID=A0A8B9DYT1_ANSCY